MRRGHYHGQPVIRSLGEPSQYQMEQKAGDWFGYHAHNGRYFIPDNGTRTDQMSVPFFFTPYVPRDAFWGGYIHDYVIAHHGYSMHARDMYDHPLLTQIIGFVPMTRKECDDLLFECVSVEIDQLIEKRRGRGSLLCRTLLHIREAHLRFVARGIWAAVRVGSWYAWNKYGKEKNHGFSH